MISRDELIAARNFVPFRPFMIVTRFESVPVVDPAGIAVGPRWGTGTPVIAFHGEAGVLQFMLEDITELQREHTAIERPADVAEERWALLFEKLDAVITKLSEIDATIYHGAR